MSAPGPIGHFVITAKLGEGGMGEVWRATDTRLHRDVALKLLPSAVAHDVAMMARFEREAHVLAALNHPNIAAVYGVEPPALVMELVEGLTLADRIAAGPVPLEEALPMARQIAEALEYAHDRGIVHRDLKPANVKVTPDGRVKVLDFGLAKAMTTDADSAALAADTRMLTSPATLAGTILGTAAYMAPEQARGQPADRRSDVWAFGVVMYELLTGRRPFVGPTISDTLAAVLKSEPDWDDVPTGVRRLVQECLRKDARERRQCVGDIRIALDHLPKTTGAPIGSAPASRAIGWARASVAAAAALVLAGAAGAAGWLLRPAAPAATTAFTISLPAGRQFAPFPARQVAISPDGTNIIYAGVENAIRRLYLRPLANPDATPITGTEGADEPFFSPDGQWIGFFQGGEDQSTARLMRVPVAGGPVEFVMDAPDQRGASWNLRGDVVLGSLSSGLVLGGTPPKSITTLAPGELSHRLPEFAGPGDVVLFTVFSNRAHNQIRAQPLGGGSTAVLVSEGTQPAYSTTGHLLFVKDHTLMAVRFDARRLTTVGQPVSMVGAIQVSDATGAAQYGLSNNGTLIYIANPDQRSLAARIPEARLEWVSRHGQEEPLPAPQRVYLQSRLSPDGRHVALTVAGGEAEHYQIWTYDISRNTLSVVTPPSDSTESPVWTPDGRALVFTSNSTDLVSRPADGSGASQALLATPAGAMAREANAISPDGKLLVFSDRKLNSRGSLWTLDVTTHQERELVPVPDPFIEDDASLSPDGKWIAFASDTTGRFEVYVRPFPGQGPKYQISSDGGVAPRWNPRGGELFFRSGTALMAVAIDARSRFTAGNAEKLFDLPAMGDYDPSPDGQRFFIFKFVVDPAKASAAPASPSTLTVVLNWAAELKRKLPQ